MHITEYLQRASSHMLWYLKSSTEENTWCFFFGSGMIPERISFQADRGPGSLARLFEKELEVCVCQGECLVANYVYQKP